MRGELNYTKLLVDAILTGIEMRYGDQFDDHEMILASVTLPDMKLAWLETQEQINNARSLVQRKLKKIQLLQSEEEKGIQESKDDYELFIFPNLHSTPDVYSEFEQYLLDSGKQIGILHKYPSILQIFLEYNTTLTSSAPVERLFRTGKLVLTPQRNRLTDYLFEKLLLLKKKSSFC
jgi:hypothetical protein